MLGGSTNILLSVISQNLNREIYKKICEGSNIEELGVCYRWLKLNFNCTIGTYNPIHVCYNSILEWSNMKFRSVCMFSIEGPKSVRLG